MKNPAAGATTSGLPFSESLVAAEAAEEVPLSVVEMLALAAVDPLSVEILVEEGVRDCQRIDMFGRFLLYTVVVIFHIYWCTRNPLSSSIML